MAKGFISAVRTLTLIPVPGKDAEKFSSALPFFPIVGILLSIPIYIVFRLSALLPEMSQLQGIILAGFTTVITGAIHVDGLADVSDGFGGGKSKEKILHIFKDPRLGTFGVLAVVLDLLLKVSLYAWYCEKNLFIFICLSIILSRVAMSMVLSFSPSAVPHSGIASSFTGGSYRRSLIIVTVALFGSSLFIVNTFIILIVLLVGAIVTILFTFVCIKKINGVTGDCIGAVNEIVEMAILISGIFLVQSEHYTRMAKDVLNFMF